MLFDGTHVRRKVTARQQAAVDLRVQRLDPAIQHFREAGMVRNLGDGNAVLGEQLGRAASGEDADVVSGEAPGQFNEAGLV